MQPLTGPLAPRLAEAKSFIARGDHAAALPVLLKLKRKTEHPDVALNLARTQMGLGDWASARENFEAVLAVVPSVDFVLLSIARCHQREDDVPSAIATIDRLLRSHPGHVQGLVLKAEMLHLQGKYGTGRDLLQPLFDKSLVDAPMLLVFGRLSGLLDDDETAERAFRAAHNSVPEQATDGERRRLQAAALYELAALYDRQEQYGRAWAAAREANALMPRPFDPDAHDAMVDRIIAAWTPEAFAALPESGVDDDSPVFVLGMPRSGTSLVEQILASHPDVHGSGERPFAHQLVRELEPHEDQLAARIERPADLKAPGLTRAARTYIDRLHGRGGKSARAARVTDKQPFNFLLIGVLARMLPGARIIHCTRDPRDVAVSCFFQSFMGAVWFANDLRHIARFQAAHDRLMDHWRMLLAGDPRGAGDRLLEVPYEQLVADQEGWSRRLVEHVGLPWDDACLRFHEADRTTLTASLDQVRRPMYATSVERWRRYEPQLAPILGAGDGGPDAAGSASPA